MDEIKERISVLTQTVTRIEGKVDKIDARTEGHSAPLSVVGAIHKDQKRMADALEKIADRHSGAMLKLAVIGLLLEASIVGLLIFAFTKTPFSATDSKGNHIEVGKP